jgi:HEAT repeat protein
MRGYLSFVRVILTTRDRALRSVAAENIKHQGLAGARALADQLNMKNSTFTLFNIVSILGTLGGEEILEGLERLVRYPDPDLRHAIVRILARLRGPKAADLALRFLGDEKESIRRLAADLLGDWKYEHAVHPLIGLLGAAFRGRSRDRLFGSGANRGSDSRRAAGSPS